MAFDRYSDETFHGATPEGEPTALRVESIEDTREVCDVRHEPVIADAVNHASLGEVKRRRQMDAGRSQRSRSQLEANTNTARQVSGRGIKQRRNTIAKQPCSVSSLKWMCFCGICTLSISGKLMATLEDAENEQKISNIVSCAYSVPTTSGKRSMPTAASEHIVNGDGTTFGVKY